MIEVTCAHCGIRVLVPGTVQGRTGVCFGCGAALRVPSQGPSVQNADLAFTIGDRISSRYIIEERIGQGGMGVVYRASDTLVNEEVALKFLKPQILRTQKGQMNFIQEAQIARRLRHDNIVAVHDISWTTEGILFLSMEFIKGQSLRAILRKHRQDRRLVDVRLAVTFIAKTLAALDYAHRLVVHRDIKPENIMILPGEQLKVLDFGLAKAIDEETTAMPSPGRAGPTLLMGTLAYAAPEQKRHRPVDLRTDIYSVGLVLYELFTLRTPIDEQLPIPSVRNDVAPSLLAVLNRALATEKEDRWQSAGEFRGHLLQAFELSYRNKTVLAAQANGGTQASTENMVFLEGGSFLMGNETVAEEAPEFEACVDPFYIDKFPVTVKQYQAFLQATGHRTPRLFGDPRFNGPSQPVIGVSWEDANAYAAWAGKQLPTETQWEYAARGKDNRLYPWGNLEPETTVCNFRDYLGMPSIVTMHEEGKTPEGVCDLGGNVYEWTQDSFLPYGASRQNHANRPTTPLRAVRGGCWNSKPFQLRCTHRRGLFPESQMEIVGFRCVVPMRPSTEI